MAKPYPFTWTKNTKEEQEERRKLWTAPSTMMIEMMTSKPMGIYMPSAFVESKMNERIWNMRPRPDDVWIITYPKCGTTLGQETLWQMSTGCNVDSEESKKNVFMRVPFLEMTSLAGKGAMPVPAVEVSEEEKKMMNAMHSMMMDTVAHTENCKSPRIIKTHLPLAMLPPNLLEVSKVVVILRNVKDACASFYHHEQLLMNQGLDKAVSFEQYTDVYMKGEVLYGNYWDNLKDAWKRKGEKNLKIIWYEDMRANLSSVLTELADFTGFDIPDEKIEPLLKHLHIDSFRKNDAVNMKPPPGSVPEEVRKIFNFIRKGKVGDWKDHFTTKEKLQEFNSWIEKNNKDEDGKPIEGFRYEL